MYVCECSFDAILSRFFPCSKALVIRLHYPSLDYASLVFINYYYIINYYCVYVSVICVGWCVFVLGMDVHTLHNYLFFLLDRPCIFYWQANQFSPY